MRTLLIGMVTSLVAAVGFAGVANASATVDLIWLGKNGSPAGGSPTTTAASSDVLTLGVFVTSGPGGVSAFGISVDYTGALAKFSVVGFNNPAASGGFNINLGTTVDTGTRISNYNAAAFFAPGLTSGQTYQAGTLQLHKIAPLAGTFTITSLVVGPPISTDDILDAGSNVITGTSTFNSAFVVNAVPEPGTAALLGLGLCGLTLAGRRRRS